MSTDETREAAEPTQVERLRCYSCGHEFAGSRNRLATMCPSCGSDSFTRNPARAPSDGAA